MATRAADEAPADSTGSNGLIDKLRSIYTALDIIPDWFLKLFARLAIVPVFWISGQGKVTGSDSFPWFDIQGGTFYMFRNEWTIPLLPAEPAAWITAIAEHLFSILLVLGLFTRFAALAFFVMTLVIQIWVYPGGWWNHHALWAFILLYLMARGPGAVSLDYLIEKAAFKRT